MRPIWTGAISFGLIHIPIRLYSASKERAFKFSYLRKKDLCPIGYVRVCKESGEEVPWKDIAKGYEYDKGDFVLLSDEDFKEADVQKSEVLEIEEFVNAREIDSKYYAKPYYVGPDHKSDKVYVLLVEALKRSHKVGIGKFVLKSKEHLVALQPENNILVLNTLRMSEEIKKPEDEITPRRSELSERELLMAIKLIEKLSGTFKPAKYHDTYVEKLEEIIEAKAKGRKRPAGKKLRKSAPTKVPDLMATLRASLKAAESRTAKK